MSLIDKYYHKIKYILLEFNNILELDNKYMNEYLNSCSNQLDINLINNSDIFEKSEIVTNENIDNNIIKSLYKKLAKKCHPDKNKNKEKDFIIINEAYKTNDILTLFIYSYENKLYNNDISDDFIIMLDEQIKKKENEINDIKNKAYWKWVESNNELEKELINSYIKSKLYNS